MILGVLLLFLYIRLFFLYSISWRKEILPEKENTSDFISVVIACRNEEEKTGVDSYNFTPKSDDPKLYCYTNEENK